MLIAGAGSLVGIIYFARDLPLQTTTLTLTVDLWREHEDL